MQLSSNRQNGGMTSATPRKPLIATPAMKAAAATRPVPAPAQGPVSALLGDTRVGEVYWCDFSALNLIPEFDAMHLIVVVRGGKKDRDIHTVLPLTKVAQAKNPHAYKLRDNPNPASADEAWAVCNHLYAVASERLRPLREAGGKTRSRVKLSEHDLGEIASRVRRALHTFLLLGTQKVEDGVQGAFGRASGEASPPSVTPLDPTGNVA